MLSTCSSQILYVMYFTMGARRRDDPDLRDSTKLVSDICVVDFYKGSRRPGPVMDMSKEIPYEMVNSLQVCRLVAFNAFVVDV